VTEHEKDEIAELSERFEAFRVAIYRSLATGALALVVTALGSGVYVGGYLGDVDDHRDALATLPALRERVAVVESGVPRVEQRLGRIEARLDALLAELRRARQHQGGAE